MPPPRRRRWLQLKSVVLIVAGIWLFVSGKVLLSVGRPRSAGDNPLVPLAKGGPAPLFGLPHQNTSSTSSSSSSSIDDRSAGAGLLRGIERAAHAAGGQFGAAPTQREPRSAGQVADRGRVFLKFPAGHPGLPFGGAIVGGGGGKVAASPFAPEGYPRSILPGAPSPSRRRRAKHPDALLGGDCQWPVPATHIRGSARV